MPEVVRERLEEGDRHRSAGRFDQALESYREARRLGPGVLEVYAALGALHVGGDDLESALEAFVAGLEIDAGDRQLLFNAAVVTMRLERFEAALGYVERALAKHRGDGDLHSLHGAILARLERPQEALTALETAAKRKSADPQIFFRLGNLHHQLGQKQQAADAFRRAIKKDGTLLRAYYNLGAVLVEMGRYDQALDAYVTALAPLDQAFSAGQPVDAVHARAYQNLGAIYFQQEKWGRALDAYNKALKLDPKLSGALYNRGFIQFRLGDFEVAESAYRDALKLDPELPLGRTEEERALYEDLLRAGGDRPELWPVRLNLGLLLLRQGATAEARPHLEALTRIEGTKKAQGNGLPALPRLSPSGGTNERKLIATVYGLLLALDGDLPGARKRLEAVLAEDAGFATAADVLAVLEAQVDPAAATEALAQSYRRQQGGPLETTARANLGQALWLAGRPGDARGHLEAAAAAYPEWISVQAAFGDVALTEQRYDDVIARLAGAAELCRETAGSRSFCAAPDGYFSTTVGGPGPDLCERLQTTLGLACVGSALERLETALAGGGGLGAVRDLADRALAVSLPSKPRAAALFVRGTARLAQGTSARLRRDAGYDAARRDLAAALAGDLPAALRPRASNNLGIALTRLGRIDEARAAYQAASPAFAEATLNLGILLDDHAGDPRAALDAYRAYRDAGGRRDVSAWIERLERIYR